jgi:hypothetical protein
MKTGMPQSNPDLHIRSTLETILANDFFSFAVSSFLIEFAFSNNENVAIPVTLKTA